MVAVVLRLRNHIEPAAVSCRSRVVEQPRVVIWLIACVLLVSGCGAGSVNSSLASTTAATIGLTVETVRSESASALTQGWQSEWVSIRYRSDPVDVGAPRFDRLAADSSLVYAAWFDEANGYLIINLQGTAYHYCGLPSSVWRGLETASSQGSYFNQSIKGVTTAEPSLCLIMATDQILPSAEIASPGNDMQVRPSFTSKSKAASRRALTLERPPGYR